MLWANASTSVTSASASTIHLYSCREKGRRISQGSRSRNPKNVANQELFRGRPRHLPRQRSLLLDVVIRRLLAEGGVDEIIHWGRELSGRESWSGLIDDVLQELEDRHLVPRPVERDAGDAFALVRLGGLCRRCRGGPAPGLGKGSFPLCSAALLGELDALAFLRGPDGRERLVA